MVNTKFDRKALSEVYEILLLLEKNKYEKIPAELIDGIKENRDKEYEVDLFELEQGNMLPDTEKILATIYFYYLSNSEEKKLINQMIENEKREKYKTIDFFKKTEDKNSDKNQELAVVKYKENKFIKIIQKIKERFLKK